MPNDGSRASRGRHFLEDHRQVLPAGRPYGTDALVRKQVVVQVQRGELLRASEDTRRCIFMLALYSGYLTGAFGISRGCSSGGSGVDGKQEGGGVESDFRQAYTLLYRAEALMREAEELESDQQRYEVYRNDN